MKKSPLIPAGRRVCVDSLFVAALFWFGFSAVVCGLAFYSWRLATVAGGFILISAFWRFFDRRSRP